MIPELFPTLQICADALFDVAYVALAGALLNRAWLGRSLGGERQLWKCRIVCSAILLLVLPLQLLLLSASMTGDSSWTDAWSALGDVATTHSGRSTIASFCCALSLLLCFSLQSRLGDLQSLRLEGILSIGLIACRAFHGHAASDGDYTLREGIQFLHLSATAVWGGGVLIAGFMTVPHLAAVADPDPMLRFGRRLSNSVTVALLIIVLSGTYNAWRGFNGSLSPILTARWGQMLVLKLCFVFAALAHGVRVRLLLGSNAAWTPIQVTKMRRWMQSEALFIVLALISSAWLANTPPPDM